MDFIFSSENYVRALSGFGRKVKILRLGLFWEGRGRRGGRQNLSGATPTPVPKFMKHISLIV